MSTYILKWQVIENWHTQNGESGFEHWSWRPTLAILEFLAVELRFMDIFKRIYNMLK
jgi:hypothetical protein